MSSTKQEDWKNKDNALAERNPKPYSRWKTPCGRGRASSEEPASGWAVATWVMTEGVAWIPATETSNSEAWGLGAGLLQPQAVLTVHQVREPTSLGSVTPCLHRPSPPAVVLFLFGSDPALCDPGPLSLPVARPQEMGLCPPSQGAEWEREAVPDASITSSSDGPRRSPDRLALSL